MDDKTFLDWYQNTLTYLVYDEGSFIYLFTRFVKDMDYNREWAQKCLDFAYRVIICKICDFGWDDISDLEILQELSQNAPIETVSWDTYQIVLTKEGEAFMLECGVNGQTEVFSPLLKERMSNLFAEHGVGFDKKDFIPVQF